MKNIKRLLCLVLMLCIMASFMAPAFAEGEEGAEEERCEVCNNLLAECVCETEPELCPECGKELSECECTEEEPELCPQCGKELSLCECTEEEPELCPECGKELSQCECTEEEPELCPQCGKELSQCECSEEIICAGSATEGECLAEEHVEGRAKYVVPCTGKEDCAAEEHDATCPKYVVPCTGKEDCAAEEHEATCPKYVAPCTGKEDCAAEKHEVSCAKAVAAIGTTGYDSLEDALTAATEGETIKLLKNITIDLNKYKFNAEVLAAKCAFIFPNGELVEAPVGSKLSASGELTVKPATVSCGGYAITNLQSSAGNAYAVLSPLDKNGLPYDMLFKQSGNLLSYGCVAANTESCITAEKDANGNLKNYLSVEYKSSYFTMGSGASLQFIVNGFYDGFKSITISSTSGTYSKGNEYLIGNGYVKIGRGSTVIDLTNKYLKTLTAGKYIMTVTYMDGMSISRFITVGVTPCTGDVGYGPYAAAMTVSAMALAAALVVLKKKEF